MLSAEIDFDQTLVTVEAKVLIQPLMNPEEMFYRLTNTPRRFLEARHT